MIKGRSSGFVFAVLLGGMLLGAAFSGLLSQGAAAQQNQRLAFVKTESRLLAIDAESGDCWDVQALDPSYVQGGASDRQRTMDNYAPRYLGSLQLERLQEAKAKALKER